MAKKSARKNRSARKRARLQEELAKRQEKRSAELDREVKLVFSCLSVALALLTTLLVFA